MSQPDHQDPERGDVIVMDDHFNHRLSAPNSSQPSQGESNFGDSSGPLFTIYSKIAEEEDSKMAERWQKDADGIIIFTGLFSAVVATFVAVSIQDIRPNSQDTSAFYLREMYQLQANSNISRPSTSSAVAQPPVFSPPTYAVWVNSLWFLSLVISLTCAMLATSLQQWARRYLRMTQPARCSPHKRARLRAYFANGLDKFRVGWAVEALPALVHLSLFIFFVGLAIYLFNINHTVFSAVACWVGLLSAVYICITLMPSFLHDCPYYSPLSSTVWFLFTIILWTAYGSLRIFIMVFRYESFKRYKSFMIKFVNWFTEGVKAEAEEIGLEGSSEIDCRIVKWTIDALSEDDALEEFLEAIPGFYRSDLVNDLQPDPSGLFQLNTLFMMAEFLDRTLSSNTVSAPVKIRRLTSCLNSAGHVKTPYGVEWLLGLNSCGTWHGAPNSVEVGHFLTSWSKANDGQFAWSVRGVNARIVSSVRERDDRWFALAMDCLGVPEHVLRDYLAHGDSLQLACLVLFGRHALRSGGVLYQALQLEPFCEFDICNTLPGLQHDFCSLWNELHRETQGEDIRMAHNAGFVFTVVRHLYFALHQGTDSALATLTLPDRRSEIRQHLWTYPLCSIPDHRSGSTSHVHESSVAEVSRPPAAASIDVPHRDSVLANITPSSLLASGLDDSTPRHPDWPSPVIESSSYPTPQLPPSNPTTPLNSASISTQPTAADHPVVLPTATTSVPHSILEATTSIALQRTGSTDHPSLSPSTLPGMSFSSSATPPPSNTHPVDSWSFPTSSSNQTPPNQDQDQGLPPGPTNSGITIPLLARQISSSSGPTIDALGDSRGPNDPASTGASHYQPADDSAPDLATDRLVPSRDSVFFPSHDLGRSQ